MPQLLGDGGIIDATFSVESLAPGAFAVFVESWSGAAGASFSRNRQYNEGLEILFSRLASLGAVISSIELAPANRPERTRLDVAGRPFPWKLGTLTDPRQLRVQVGRAQTQTNSRPGKGNRSKRLCIYCRVPGFSEGGLLSEMIQDGIGRSEAVIDESDFAGFQSSPEVRTVVEQHAMDAATQHYARQGWNVDASVARTESFDLLCTRAREVLHVEAKGTTGRGREVLLTWREVEHARRFPRVALVVVSGIVVVRESVLSAYGGRMAVFDPWRIDECQLSATQYRCAVPALT